MDAIGWPGAVTRSRGGRAVRAAWLALAMLLAAGAQAAGLDVARYVVDGDNPLSGAETDAVLAPHTGALAGLNDLIRARDALQKALRERGYAFHHVSLPPQTVAGGSVRLQVGVFTVGTVSVDGNDHYSVADVRRALPALASGRTPVVSSLLGQLQIANENGARQLSLNLKEGARPDVVDAEIVVEERDPLVLFALLNNTGSAESGRARLSLGLQHADLLGLDDGFSLLYTTSPEHPSRVTQVGSAWRLPLYATGAVVSLQYAHSDVDSGRIADVFDVSGAGDFAGITWTQHLQSIGGYRQRLAFTLDDRLFDNDVAFNGQPIGGEVRSRPVTVRYDADLRFAQGSLAFNVAYVRNTPTGAHNGAADYAAARAPAGTRWDVARFGVQLGWNLPRTWQLRAAIDGQLAGEALIPGEQFGLGGAQSVRAFEERSVTGDDGVRASVELWAPALPRNVRLFGFVDGGYVERQDTLPDESDHDDLVGAGLGLRWQWQDRVSVGFDYGHELDGARAENAGRSKLHANVLVRY
jgi:hemolysin activation/secretion protein